MKSHNLEKKSSKRRRGFRKTYGVARERPEGVKKLLEGRLSDASRQASRPRAQEARARSSSRRRATTGRKNSSYRFAKEQVDHSLAHAYRDRKARKRTFRSLWIVRINAAARANGLSYNRFMAGVRQGRDRARPQVARRDRGVDPQAFAVVAEQAKAALEPDADSQAA